LPCIPLNPDGQNFRDPANALLMAGLDAPLGIGMILKMPRKVRQLIADLERAGFVDRGGKGSHRNYVHPTGPRVTVSGKPGADAHHYQEKQVRQRMEEAKK
jgi:predicted RNA binding protein YcfA (HicA-like mRNA interferase family)